MPATYPVICTPNLSSIVHNFSPNFPFPNSTNSSNNYDAAYWYSKNGNMNQLKRNDNNGVKFIQDYNYAAGKNWLTSVDWTEANNPSDNTVYGYDALGNLTWDEKSDNNQIVYNLLSNLPIQMQETTGSNNELKNFRYNAQDQRLVKEISLGNTLVDVEYYIEDVILNANGEVKSYQTGIGFAQPNFSTQTINYFYNIKDWLGSNRVVLDQTGSPVNVTDHYPYGEKLLGRATIFSPESDRFQFTGHEYDDETGYEYHGARYFNRTLGRYMSIDPLAAQFPSHSVYNYTLCNPIMFIDPDGRAADDFVQKKDGSIYWDNNANSQGTTKSGETYLGKSLIFEFESYIDAETFDVPMGTFAAGTKLTSTIRIDAIESDKGELMMLVPSSSIKIGWTPLGTARDYYPGEGGSDNHLYESHVTDENGNLKKASINFEQHASVSLIEEIGMRSAGFNIVDVAQQLQVSFNNGNLYIGTYTNVFPSAKMSINEIPFMQYNQPSFIATHYVGPNATYYYPSVFFKR